MIITSQLPQNTFVLHHFANDILGCIFLNGNVWISVKISLKFVHKIPVNNIPALVQIMAWCRPGDKPLSEPMMVNLLTHICVTRPQWVNILRQMNKIIAILQTEFSGVCFEKSFIFWFQYDWISLLRVQLILNSLWVLVRVTVGRDPEYYLWLFAYSVRILTYIGSCMGLVVDGTKPSSEQLLTHH